MRQITLRESFRKSLATIELQCERQRRPMGPTVAVSHGLPSITVSGYVIDCAASRCEPILTQ